MDITKLKAEGGQFLLAARSWMQWNKHNGSSVKWGSNEILLPHLTVAEVEDLAAHVALPYVNAIERLNERIIKHVTEVQELRDALRSAREEK